MTYARNRVSTAPRPPSKAQSTAKQQTLPAPPSDDEKYWYLGRQHRWLVLLQAVTFLGVVYSLFMFARVSYWTLIILLPLSLYVIELALAFRTTLFRRRVFKGNHDETVREWRAGRQPNEYPSIDVYLPTAGEPAEVLDNTYDYVGSLEWPGEIHFYVLDDAGRDEVQELARLHGFNYIHRKSRTFKKAGNLSNAFTLTSGDIIAIFDADFVPRPDFLYELVPYMEDPSVGIVQSPQVFDTDKSMNWIERGAGATQEQFYRFIQSSRDSVGASICVGTSAIYRRRALETIGGFPQIDHSEDVHTGLGIGRHGYSTRYVPVIVSKGACPDNMNAFVNQQYRWCEGSLSIMEDPSFHLDSELSNSQRMSFWAGILYYISTAVNAFLGPLPAVIMLLLFPTHIKPLQTLVLAGPLVLWFIVYPLLFKYRWRVDVMRVQVLYAFTHAVACLHQIQRKDVEWVPTGGSARATPLAVTVRRLLMFYLGPVQIAIAALLVWDVAAYGLGRIWVTLVLALVAFYIMVPVVVHAYHLAIVEWIGRHDHPTPEPSTPRLKGVDALEEIFRTRAIEEERR